MYQWIWLYDAHVYFFTIKHDTSMCKHTFENSYTTKTKYIHWKTHNICYLNIYYDLCVSSVYNIRLKLFFIRICPGVDI